ncbi:MAG: response regulator [Oligoflexia bacterium]|nr:response regulator [Oligoflexia bacterium]
MTDSGRVLVVDDFEMVRVTLRECLKQLGFSSVEEAQDGEIAWKMILSAADDSQPYAMVFADLNMPNKNGLELLVACRQDPRFASLPFVMVSAESERQYVIQCLQRGANDYVIKPFSTQTLQRKIEKVTARLRRVAA